MEALTVKDIRIGNLITSGNNGKFDGELSIGKVLSIGAEDNNFEQVYCECEESFEWFFKDNYFGIPLTEEWLLKMGFRNNGGLFRINDYVFVGGNLAVLRPDVKKEKVFGRNFKYTRGNFIADNLNYVHQLQNLYYALTNTELTINL